MNRQFATDRVDAKAWTGRVLGGKYRLEQCIGRSADTLVYRAQQLNLRRDVAVKILFANPRGAMQLGDRMRREARLIAAIRHPGVAEMYDEGVTAEGRPYLVMELLRGQTLEDLVAVRGRLEPNEAVGILLQIAATLGAVHGAGFAHRDIKPSNIFLEQTGSDYSVKLIDFGTARPVAARFSEDVVAKKTLDGLGGGTQINTLPGIVFGTPSFMSPEQCRGDDVDSTTDVYSLGVVFYLMLTGVLPFEDVHAVRVMARHLVEVPAKLSLKAPDVSGLLPLEPVVARALAKDRTTRFQSAHELAQAAASALETASTDKASEASTMTPLPLLTRSPARTLEPTRPVRRRRASTGALSRGWIFATTALSMAGLLVATVFAVVRWHADAERTESAPALSSSVLTALSANVDSTQGKTRIEQSTVAESTVLRAVVSVPPTGDAEATAPKSASRTTSLRSSTAASTPAPAQTGKTQSSEPEKGASRFTFGLNELMRPRGAEEK